MDVSAPEKPAEPERNAAEKPSPRGGKKIPLTPPGNLPVEEAWDQYFATNRPHAGEIADVVLRLHQAKKPAELVACLEAALRNGQGQPWMYTILALEMEQVGRPPAEVRRVLLSMIDSQTDPANLMYTAAFLTRYGSKDKALELYRQASQVDPTRLEPYVMGMRLAGDSDDVDSAIWAINGILQRAWQKDYEKLHRDALAISDALEQKLRQSDRLPDAERLAQAVRLARQRDLFVELTWSGKADLDLIVEEPGGTVCSFDNPQTPGGGILAHDGHGADQKDALDRYVCPRGLPGEYRLRVRYNAGTVVGKRAVLRIVRYQGTPQEVEDRQSIELSTEDRIVRVSLNRGRLRELGWVPLLKAEERPRERAAGEGRREQASRRREMAGLADRNRRQAAANVGYQPVIQILPDGISNTALAVVSADRRYVRLSMSPTFSTITDVFTFSFLTGGRGGRGGVGGIGGGGGGGIGGGLQ